MTCKENYYIGIIWEDVKEFQLDYKYLSKEIIWNTLKVYESINKKNLSLNKYKDIILVTTPNIWSDSIFLTAAYLNNLKCDIFIPELKWKEDNKNEIMKVLKSEYNYNKKQIDLFLKIIEWNNIKINSDFLPLNLACINFFGDLGSKTYKRINNALKSKISCFDILIWESFDIEKYK